jgi:type IV secretory pathway VirB3-like protein
VFIQGSDEFGIPTKLCVCVCVCVCVCLSVCLSVHMYEHICLYINYYIAVTSEERFFGSCLSRFQCVIGDGTVQQLGSWRQ